MTAKPWQFTISGSGADGSTFETTGKMQCEFHDSFDLAMKSTFDQLTSGRAIYGKPGVGCRGPYDITKLVIEQVKQ